MSSRLPMVMSWRPSFLRSARSGNRSSTRVSGGATLRSASAMPHSRPVTDLLTERRSCRVAASKSTAWLNIENTGLSLPVR
jgi:hypothetical protein